MRLTLRGLLVTFLLGALALMAGCSADSPTPTSNNGGGGGGNSALAIQLSTTNASPKAGTCTIVQAFATLNGSAVPDGTSIVLSTSFGVFAQNGLQTISLVSQSGGAAATVCSDSEGTVTVKGTVTLSGKQGQKSLLLQFTSNGLPSGPFISVCSNPHSGPVTGGTAVTISGGGFGTSLANVRVFFRSGAVIHQAVVTSVTDSTITATTPAFPELNGLGATSVDVQVVLGGGFILDSPNCFTYTASSAFVSICANPGSGPLTGGTAVTIQGGGFGTDPASVQVLFRIGSTTEPAVVQSVTDTTINVLTPAFAGLNPTTPNVADIIIKIGAQITVTSPACFTYTSTGVTPVVSSILPTSGTKLGGTRATILGSGFSSPVQVFFGAVQAEIVSVSFSQIVVITPPLQGNAAPGAVPVVVKNAACGTGTNCQSNGNVTFTYTVPLHITTFSPVQGDASTVVTILGEGFVAPLQVLFGSQEGTVVSVTGTQILVKPPAGCGVSGAITVTLISTGESATSSASFTGVGPTINPTNGLVPSSGPANTPTAAVVNGSNLFESGNPQLSIFNAHGGTVTITGTSELNGGQFVNVSITPDGSASTVTFAIRNDTTGCVSGQLTFTVTNAPQITAALTPNTGPIGTCTTATVSGTGLFPTGVPGGVSIANVTGPGTVSILTATDGATQTLTLSICPTGAGAITFQIRNTGTGLLSSVLTFTATCGTTASAPTPSSGPSGQPNTVTVTGTGLFPTGNPGAASIVNVSGGTVIISGAVDGATQTLTLTITPTTSGCTPTVVTFAIKNTVSGCTSGPLSFTGTAGITVSAPNPSSGPAGVTTHNVTVSGTGMFPTGQGSQLVVNSQSGGTVVITGTTDGTTQSATFDITPNAATSCANVTVTFTLKNNSTGCVSGPLTFTGNFNGVTLNSGQPVPSTGPSPSSVTVTGTNFFRVGFPSDATIVNQAGGTVTITNRILNGDGTETLVVSISATNPSVGGLVTFQIENTSITGTCKDSSTLQFTATTCSISVSSPNPSSGPAGSPTQVTVNVTGVGSAPNVCDPTAATCGTTSVPVSGGTVSIVGTTSSTMTLNITPTASCTGGNVTFVVKNTTNSCVSSTVSFTGIGNQPLIVSGPTPATGPSTQFTDVTITGTNLFPTGNPSALQVCNASGTGCGTTNVAVTNGTATIISATDGSTQTVKLRLTPAKCDGTPVTFTLKNTGVSCTSGVLSFNVNPISVISGPALATNSAITSSPAGIATHNIKITGTGFFPVGNPAAATVTVTNGNGSVVIDNAVDNGDGTQSLFLTITPFATGSCSPVNVGFTITDTALGSCTTGQLSWIGVQAPTIVFGPNPASISNTGTVTVTGLDFFRSGIPTDALVCNVAGSTCGTTNVAVDGGTITIMSATDDLSTNLQTLTLNVVASGGCGTFVKWIIKNNFTTCQSNPTFVTNTGDTTIVPSFSQTPGASGSGQITFSSTSSGGTLPYSCSWVFAGNNAGSPTPSTSTSCGPVLVTWDCGTGGTPCTNTPSANLTVTDKCGNSASTGAVGVSPP